MSVIDRVRHRYQGAAEPQRSERRFELILLVLILVVSLQVLWWVFVRMGNVSVAAVAPAEDSMRVIDAQATGAITASESQQLQSRPVFWASRRPDAKAAAPQQATPGNKKPARRLEDLQVAGALGAGEQGKAIIIYKDKLMRLGIGDKVAGWSLQSVSLGEVVFVSAGARDVRRLAPMPVIAAQKPSAADSQASTETAPATPQAAASKQASAPKSAPKKNNEKEATLSLGG